MTPEMVRIPPPIWTLLFLMIAGGASYAMPPSVNLRVLPLGIVLVVSGIALAVSAFVRFRSEGTEIDPVSVSNKSLVINGPYRFTRNPMYLSLVVLSLGIAFIAGAWPMFVVPVLVFAVAAGMHIPLEEEKMRRQFGAAYDAYVVEVRRWI